MTRIEALPRFIHATEFYSASYPPNSQQVKLTSHYFVIIAVRYFVNP
jgi:hypothetical protein